ncbi:MAG: hypothetical protein HOW97_09505 [Catenulispora sp.]|nr:hypothetical protein [Catenulispora sp.]
MSPVAVPEMRVFIVNTGEVPSLHAGRIEAAYYQHESGFTTFKDSSHQAVYAVRDEHLVSIERAREAEPIVATLVQTLNDARNHGNATGRITETETDPDGVVTETGFDITIRCFGGVDATRSTAAPIGVSSRAQAAR